jgi:hypothetical protein
MGRVKSAMEIALEKTGNIGELSREEKKRMEGQEKITSILREFYRGKLDPSGLWQRLKGSEPSLLKMAQMNLISTLGLGSLEEEFQFRRQAIVAIETLKERPDTAVIEVSLNSIESLQKEYLGMKEKVAEDLRRQMEKHPQLRMQPLKTRDGRTVMQMNLSADEAVKARLAEYISEHEERFSREFLGLIEELKAQIH